ncbi:MAG: hypothetical protein K6A80_06695 [Saccharofermentans sp.]|nr:hypothetical protein [Saccharofermentans sp.]
MRDYSDMVNLTRPQYADLPPMPIHDRAAQFSPFAALVGYDDAVAETARLTDSKREISEEETVLLNASLVKLSECINQHPLITIDYFIPDQSKEGGSYSQKTGNIRKYDQFAGILEFADGEYVSVSNIYNLHIP